MAALAAHLGPRSGLGTAKEVVGEIIAGVLDAENIAVDASVVEYLASALEECSGEEDLRSVVAPLVPEFLASYGVDDFIASASVCEKIVESLKEGKSKERSAYKGEATIQ